MKKITSHFLNRRLTRKFSNLNADISKAKTDE